MQLITVSSTGRSTTVIDDVEFIAYAKNLSNSVPSTVICDDTGPEGIYRISMFLACTTAGTAGTVTGNLTFTAPWGADSVATSALSLTARAKGPATVIYAVCAANTTINASTTVTGATGSPVYAAAIAIERLI